MAELFVSLLTLGFTALVIGVIVLAAVLSVVITMVPIVLIVGLALKVAGEQRKARQKVWREVAAERGLVFADDELRGPVAGRPMVLELTSERRGDNNVTVTSLRVHVDAVGKLEVRPQGWLQLSPDQKLGDPTFDRAADVRGSDTDLGLLSPRVRTAWMQHKGKMSLIDGFLELRRDGSTGDRAALEQLLSVAEEVTTCWADGRTPTQRLGDGVATDQPAPVRARMLRTRLQIDDDGARALAAACRDDAAPLVRVAAAEFLSDSDTLRQVACQEDAGPEARQRAATTLVGTDHLGTALQSLCASEERRLWFHACKLGQQAACPGVVQAMALLHQRGILHTKAAWSPRLASGAAHALRTQGDFAAEPVLLSLLTIDEGDVGLHAAKALATCGTTAAVAPLRARESDYSMISPMGGIVRDTVRAIQGRASGERGGLAIAEVGPARGALSEAEPERAPEPRPPRPQKVRDA